jgi:hypothetical protein
MSEQCINTLHRFRLSQNSTDVRFPAFLQTPLRPILNSTKHIPNIRCIQCTTNSQVVNLTITTLIPNQTYELLCRRYELSHRHGAGSTAVGLDSSGFTSWIHLVDSQSLSTSTLKASLMMSLGRSMPCHAMQPFEVDFGPFYLHRRSGLAASGYSP